MQQVMTVNEVASYLKRSAYTIRQWIKAGRLPARRIGKSYLITEESVRALVEPASPTEETVTRSPKQMRQIREFIAAMRGSGMTLDVLEQMRRDEVEMERRTLRDLGLE